MPMIPASWIRTEKGTQRVLLREQAAGLGVSKDKLDLVHAHLRPAHIVNTTSTFIWEFLVPLLVTELPPVDRFSWSVQPITEDESPESDNEPFVWTMPDISHGSPWYEARVKNLHAAAACYPDPEPMIANGLEMLCIHRGNYNSDGPDPKELQILWWEFPSTHWDALRDGSR